MGGTKTAVGLVDRFGEVQHLTTSPTGEPGVSSLGRAAGVVAQTAAMAGDRGRHIVGIGVGVPELVEDGRITSDAVVGWTNAKVEEAFGGFGPIRIEADIRAAALAEARRGRGADTRVALYVNLGTGISHCLLIEGRPYEGQHGRALLSGSTRLVALDTEQGRLVGSCVEDLASGRGISGRYLALSGNRMSALEVFELAGEGDRHADLVVSQAIDLIGHLMANLIDILDPGTVIVGGGLSDRAGLLEGITEAAHRSVWSDRARAIPIVSGTCGPQAGVIGAGLALWEHLPR